MKVNKKLFLSFSLLISLFCTSCIETVAVGSFAGAIVVTREKTLSQTAADIKIATKIHATLLQNGLKSRGSYVEVMVNEGRVLLLGAMTDPVKAKTASILAWKVEGVKEVIDEIELIDEDRFNLIQVRSGIKDHLITSQIEIRMFFTRDIYSRNYKVATLRGTTYLLGVSYSEEEMQKVLSVVSKTKGVKKVVNHVVSVDDSRRK